MRSQVDSLQQQMEDWNPEEKVLGRGLTCEPLTQEVDECIVVHRVELDQVLHRVATQAELVTMLFWYPRHTVSKGAPRCHRVMYPCCK